MSVDSILASGDARVMDDVFVMEMYYPSSDPPYRDPNDLPMFEGGIVQSVSGTTITFSQARRAINPATRADDYAKNFGDPYNQNGRILIVWSGSSKGETRNIVGSGTNTLTVDEAVSLSAGDVCLIANRIDVSSLRVTKDIDTLTAGLSAAFGWDGTTLKSGMIRSASWVYWRQAWESNTESTGWMDVGLFQVASPPKSLSPEPQISLTGYDALRQLDIQPFSGVFSADKIEEHSRATNSPGGKCVILKMIDESNDDAGMYRCFHSPETTDAAILVNHTVSWCVLPPPVIYASKDNNDTITSSTDQLIPITNGIDIIYGRGELRIQAKTWNDLYDEGFRYVKAQYSRFAQFEDLVASTATNISGTTLSDSSRSGALAFITTGIGLKDMTVRMTSGNARGQTFKVSSNTSNTITATSSFATAGVVAGDAYELYNINDPLHIVEDLLVKTDFQMCNPNLPFYIDTFDRVFVPGYAEIVQFYNGSSYTDISAAVQDETTVTSTMSANGHIIYFGSPRKINALGLWIDTREAGGSFVWEYWNGSSWTSAQLAGFTNGTSNLTENGTVRIPPVNDWRPTSVNGSDQAFFLRVRCTGLNNTVKLRMVELQGVPSAPGPDLADWAETIEEDDRKPSEIIQNMRSSGLIPPNWVVFADNHGVVQAKAIEQGNTAAWSYDRMASVEESFDENSIRTGVVVKGQSYSTENIATRAEGATIEQSSELKAKLSAGSVEIGVSNDNSEHSLWTVISDSDLREEQRIANGVLPGIPADWVPTNTSGPQLRYRWGYKTSENPNHYRELDNLPLWIVDLGQQYDDISEVAIVVDNGAHAWIKKAGTKPGDIPIFALDVSNDKTNWLPLCDQASAQSIKQQGALSEYIYTSGSSHFQRSFRYIRKRCVVAGWLMAGRTADLSYESGQVVVLKVRRSGELTRLLWLGSEPPFTSTQYTNMKRRFRRRLAVEQVVDPTADTDDKLLARARKRLREWQYITPERTIDGIRPDAKLFDTVAVTIPELGLDAESHLITALSVSSGGDISCTMRNYVIGS